MDTNDLYLFTEVAESLSFKEAASRLGVSRSAVSKRIALLEKEIGTMLLSRSPRSTSLTPAGALFLERCKEICKILDDAHSKLQSDDQKVRGVLRLSIPSTLGTVLIRGLVQKFLRRHPKLRVSARLGESDTDVLGGGIDVAVRIAKRLPDSGLRARRLLTTGQVLAASPRYLADQGTPSHVRELRQHKCLGVSQGTKSRATWHFSGSDGPHNVPIEYVFTSNSDFAVKSAAIAGMGIILVPALIIQEELNSGSLAPVLSEFCKGLNCGVYALYSQKDPPLKVSAFINFLHEQLASICEARPGPLR